MVETTGNRKMQTRTTDKPFNITKKQVYEAYKAVKSNAGAAGVDKQTLEQFDADLRNNLYKLWNRMSSGSYFPPPVRAVPIPKKTGGRIELLRWLSNNSLSRIWTKYSWQTPTATGRRNRRSMPWTLRVNGAGNMIGSWSSISKVCLIISTMNSCCGLPGST